MKRIRIPTEQDYTDCQEFALHDFPELANSRHLELTNFDKRFRRIQSLRVGVRAVYLNEQYGLVHFGLGTSRGTIISKRGVGGLVYEHTLFEPELGEIAAILYDIPLREEFDFHIERALRGES